MEYINLSNIKITQNNIKLSFYIKVTQPLIISILKIKIIININVTYYNAIIR